MHILIAAFSLFLCVFAIYARKETTRIDAILEKHYERMDAKMPPSTARKPLSKAVMPTLWRGFDETVN